MNDNLKEDNVYQQSKNRRKYLIATLVFMMILGIGYAYLQTTLTISGTTKVDKNTWNVYWDNLEVMDNSVLTEEAGESAATINPSKITEVLFSVNLDKPGEYYEFTVDAKNEGTIDAMISTITKKVNNSETIPAYLEYTVTYDDNEPVLQKQKLRAGTMETYRVKVAYNKNIEVNQLPGDDETLSLTFGVTYEQADSTAINVRNEIFHVNDYTAGFTIGQQVPTEYQAFDNYRDAIHALGYPMFVRHIINNNVIEKTDVGFVYNGKLYYLRAGTSSYENNKIILMRVFGQENCQDTLDDEDPSNIVRGYLCHTGNIDYGAQITDNGSALFGVGIGDNHLYVCTVEGPSGMSSCMEMEIEGD